MACQELQAMAIHSPSSRGVLPLGSPQTFNLNTNCNVKSRLEFRPLSSFTDPTKIKGLSYTVKDPNVETALQEALISVPGQRWSSRSGRERDISGSRGGAG